jgi:hypothetical protein
MAEREKTLQEMYQELVNQGLIYPSMTMPDRFVYPSDQMTVPTMTVLDTFDSASLKRMGLGDDDAQLESSIYRNKSGR